MAKSVRRAWHARGTVLAGLLALGCGSDPYELTDVTGTVTCNGKPALGGWVIFEPIDAPDKTGRPAGAPGGISRGIVNEDGSFTMVMDAKGSNPARDGALIGPTRVSFYPPRTEAVKWNPQDDWLPKEEQDALKEQLASYKVYEPLECGLTITPNEVEVVKGGDNTFTFTLSGAPLRPRGNTGQSPSD